MPQPVKQKLKKTGTTAAFCSFRLLFLKIPFDRVAGQGNWNWGAAIPGVGARQVVIESKECRP